MEWGLVFAFLKEIVSGEVWRLWQRHQAEVKARAVADSPATKAELIGVLDKAEI